MVVLDHRYETSSLLKQNMKSSSSFVPHITRDISAIDRKQTQYQDRTRLEHQVFPPPNNDSIDDQVQVDQFKAVDLVRQRDDALKREEAARDRLKLQEAINAKQIQELRNQIKKLAAENQKLQRSSWAGNPVRMEKKRDGRGQNREIREMNKTIEQLKNENLSLQKKLDQLSNFVQVAGEMKHQAITQCREQNALIHRLHEEKQAAYQLRNEEIRKRFQVEGELHSLQTYVEYNDRKGREKSRNKSVQTTTSIPLRMSFANKSAVTIAKRSSTSLERQGSAKLFNSYTGSGAANYIALKSAASALRLQSVEKSYRKETLLSKQKFTAAAKKDAPSKEANVNTTTSDDQLHGQHRNSKLELRFLTESLDNKDYLTLYDSRFKKSDKQLKTEQELSNASQVSAPPPPPPPPVRTPFRNGKTSLQKFNQHTVAIGPAAIVYKARIDI